MAVPVYTEYSYSVYTCTGLSVQALQDCTARRIRCRALVSVDAVPAHLRRQTVSAFASEKNSKARARADAAASQRGAVTPALGPVVQAGRRISSSRHALPLALALTAVPAALESGPRVLLLRVMNEPGTAEFRQGAVPGHGRTTPPKPNPPFFSAKPDTNFSFFFFLSFWNPHPLLSALCSQLKLDQWLALILKLLA